MYRPDDLLHLMARLRSPEFGRPWDLQQSYATIVPHTLEEACEVANAIEQGNFPQLREELGDLLFQVVCYGQLAREEDRFALDEVVDGITRKLIRRHFHVFLDGDLYGKPDATKLAGAAIERRWEELKAEERAAKAKEPQQLSLLDDVPVAPSTLSRVAKLQKRAAQVGSDWPEAPPVVGRVRGELDEVLEAMAEGDEGAVGEEVGDLLFVVINLARHLRVDPGVALRQASGKFKRRFRFIERNLREAGRKTEECSLEELDSFWGEARKAERSAPGC